MFAGPGKYIAGIVGAVVIGMVITIWILNSKVDRLEEWQDNIVAVTSAAAHTKNKKGKPALLKKSAVSLQITYLGGAVDNLKSALAVKNAESEKRAQDFIDSRTRAKADRERLERQFAQAQGSISRLRAIAENAAANDDGQCKASDDLIRELEGL